MADSPPSKVKKEVDFGLCFICQMDTGPTGDTNLVVKPKLPSVDKLIKSFGERYQYGETKFASVQKLFQRSTAEELMSQGLRYHRECYSDTTNKTLIDRAKTRFEKGMSSGSVSNVTVKKRGRPTSSFAESTPPTRRCSREQAFDNTRCVFCQVDTGSELHKVSTQNMGNQIRQIGRATKDDVLKVRLNSVITSDDPLQAMAEDMKYHLPCLVKVKRDIDKAEKQTGETNVNFSQVLSDLELLEVVGNVLNTNEHFGMNMNDIQLTYVHLLKSNGFPVVEKHNYKPYLKQLILDNIQDVHISRPTNRRKSEQVLSTKLKDRIISSALTEETLKDDLKTILRAAKILRKDIASHSTWKFSGTFDDYESPPMLKVFCKHAVMGTEKMCDVNREESLDLSASMLAQHFVTAYKSDTQVSHEPIGKDGAFRQRFETPLSVGLALDVHKNTRAKAIVEKLAHLDLSISYNKVMEIETSIANSVLKQMESTGGICVPPWLVPDTFVWYALDNIDFLESTPCGMNTLHGTAIAIYQSVSPEKSPMMSPIKLDRSSRARTLQDAVSCKMLACEKPRLEKRKGELKILTSKPESEKNKRKDMSWMIGNFDFDGDVTIKPNGSGTWGAFNSLTSPTGEKTNVALVPPLIRSPPTGYETLYTGLMKARDITTHVMGSEAVTVMTLDMQLYDMAMKLWVEREDIRKQFLFRPGELHIVLWALASLGNYVEGSGIDQAWVEAGLYSPTTVNQILNGRHMYRAVEAHMVTLIALYRSYFQRFLTTAPEKRHFLAESSACLEEAYRRETSDTPGPGNHLIKRLNEILGKMESENILSKLEESEENATKIQRFILNYMKQFETILMFIRSTRQRNLSLHMESVQSLVKYFFAHDHLNYARMLPLYLSTMHETETKHPELWREFMNGNFCVTKGCIGFTSIAPDHGIEQENRTLKVIGGIVGITQNDKALDRFFLIAPELSKLLSQFSEQYDLRKRDREIHHEVTGGKLSRVMSHASKLSNVFQLHGDPFIEDEADEVFNLLTREVMNEQVSKDILERDEIGQELFEKFTTERIIEGKLSVWEKMTKRKLRTFKSVNATAEIRSDDKLIKLKEERGLLQRFIVISRSRPELDLKQCVGTYEFGIVPRSLFASDGSLLLAYDKAKILHHLERLIIREEQDSGGEHSEQLSTGTNSSEFVVMEQIPTVVQEPQGSHEGTRPRVIIIDGMAIVNGISKTEQIRTCGDFAQAFIERLEHIARSYDEVRLVFDRYITSSLKDKMRRKRTKGKSTYYHIRDSTVIKNISLKDFLSNVKTKAELTEYLATQCISYSKAHPEKLKKFLVTSGTVTKGNTSVPAQLLTHSQEEADTLVILHALTVEKHAEVTIDSPDTDIFILLIHRCSELPLDTRFLTGKGKTRRSIPIKQIYDALGEKRASALLGFHTFTGTDMSGRFAGKTKEWCFKVFLTCDEKIWKALESLGHTDLSADTYTHLERYVCLLYKSKVHTKLKDLRWYLYSNRAAQGESLPPTTGALNLHIQRANYIAMIWRKATESHPSLPSPVEYGWQLLSDDGPYIAIRSSDPPAPEAVMNLIKCGCKKGCTGLCSCRSNSIPCTELCGCVNYQCDNKPSTHEPLVMDMDENDEWNRDFVD